MRLIVYTNILTPYRKYFFDILSQKCREKGIFFKVLLMTETEPNRNWKYDDLKTDYTILLKNRSYDFNGIYIHYNPNLKEVIKDLNPTHIVCAGSYLCPGVNTILNMKKKYNFETYFWSESHLLEEKNNSKIKIIIREHIRNYIYKKFDGFWYAGKLSLDFVEKYANKKFKKIFVPNLVNNDIFDYHLFSDSIKNDVIEKYGLNNCKHIIICPARLTKVKGIDKFLDLISLSKYRKEISIIIPGNGELENEIKRKAKQYEIDVRILGFLDQNEVAKLYSISNFFLMPSLSDPNPLTCIEALWEGLPLIVSEHVGNYKEVVKENVNGFIFKYNDDIKKIDLILEKVIHWTDEDYKKAKLYSYTLARKNYLAESVIERICIEMREA